jgi:hypothetical protein
LHPARGKAVFGMRHQKPGRSACGGGKVAVQRLHAAGDVQQAFARGTFLGMALAKAGLLFLFRHIPELRVVRWRVEIHRHRPAERRDDHPPQIGHIHIAELSRGSTVEDIQSVSQSVSISA